VEGHVQPAAQTNLEFFTYLAAALIFTAAIVLNLVRPLSWRGWLAGLASGAGWLITWYAPVSIWLGMVLELLVVCLMIWAFVLPGAPRRATSLPRPGI
jgi:hypothetical protein